LAFLPYSLAIAQCSPIDWKGGDEPIFNADQSMKINPTNSKSIAGLSRSSATSPSRLAGAAGAPSRSEPTDQTQISKLSTYLASAISGSSTHLARLSALGSAVSSGRYQVDSDVLGDDIVQHSLLFSGAW
jgi:anti-sigma28 factor (negative regulator of flagellin synthesis)